MPEGEDSCYFRLGNIYEDFMKTLAQCRKVAGNESIFDLRGTSLALIGTTKVG